jgi:hypothetical protein
LPHDQEESVTNQATAHVLIAVTAPTAENATEWATTVSDLVQAEYGDTMRLAVRVSPPAAAPSAPADRAALSARLWAVAEHNIIAEWICCEPINPKHELCVQGDATLRMVKALLVDDPEAIRPAPLLDAVLAVLPPPANRAAVLREAADELAAPYEPESGYDRGRAWVIEELRRMAVEAQQPTPCDKPNACEDGGDPCTTHEREQAHAEGDHGLCGVECSADRCTCDSEDHTHDGGCPLYEPDGDAQQPETQADAHPPTVTWEIESPRCGTWASWGTTYDEHDWARQRFEDAIDHVPARRFRLVRATTTYTVEAEPKPAT